MDANQNSGASIGPGIATDVCGGGVMLDQGGERFILTTVQALAARLNWSVHDIDVVGSHTDLRRSIIAACYFNGVTLYSEKRPCTTCLCLFVGQV
jgi:hypothetical protein